MRKERKMGTTQTMHVSSQRALEPKPSRGRIIKLERMYIKRGTRILNLSSILNVGIGELEGGSWAWEMNSWILEREKGKQCLKRVGWSLISPYFPWKKKKTMYTLKVRYSLNKAKSDQECLPLTWISKCQRNQLGRRGMKLRLTIMRHCSDQMKK